jgi:ABC-type taurine transport system substrate-binding protein
MGAKMIDEAKARDESAKIAHIAELALEVDVEVMRGALQDSEFLVALLDGWLGDMLRAAVVSTRSFLEYREKIDAMVSDMGLDMLLNLGKGEQWDA